MKYMEKKRTERVEELKKAENDILKVLDKPDEKIIELINKINYIILVDDGLIEEYKRILKTYECVERARDVFEHIIPIIKEKVGEVEIGGLGVDIKFIKIKNPSHSLIVELVNTLETDDILNSNAIWYVEYDKNTNTYTVGIEINE